MLGLRSRAARGILKVTGGATPPKTRAEDVKPEDEQNKTGAADGDQPTDDEGYLVDENGDRILDENGNPIKKEEPADAAGDEQTDEEKEQERTALANATSAEGRIEAILTNPAAAKNQPLANFLAFKTKLGADQAVAALKLSAPAGTPVGASSPFHKAMVNTGNARVPATSGSGKGPAAGSEEEAAASAVATMKAFGFSK